MSQPQPWRAIARTRRLRDELGYRAWVGSPTPPLAAVYGTTLGRASSLINEAMCTICKEV